MGKKAESKGTKETCFDFPFMDPKAMKEMMKMWRGPGMDFCRRCMSKAEERSDEPKKTAE